MTRRLPTLTSISAVFAFAVALQAASSVYPTGTTIFHPDKTWSGFTVFITPETDA